MCLHIYEAGGQLWITIIEAVKQTIPVSWYSVNRNFSCLVTAPPDHAWDEPVVVCLHDDAELDELVGAAQHLQRYNMALILHKDDQQTLSKARMLCPRLLFVQPIHASIVGAVIARMVASQRENRNQEMVLVPERPGINRPLERVASLHAAAGS